VPVVVRIGPGIGPGWLVAAVGIGLDVVGWYQVSGQPTEAQQLPYLASATIPGAALIVAGAVLIAADRRTAGMITRSGAASVARPSERGGLWALPDGSYLHRADCPLLDGKPEAYEVTAEQSGSAADDSTPRPPRRPCPICEPDPVPAP
jgi:hypothetical protein